MISPRKDSLTDYEDARRSIENPVEVAGSPGDDSEVYRDEGMTADKDRHSTTIFERIGISTKRKRKVEVARSEFAAAEKIFAEAKVAEGTARKKKFREAAEKYKSAAENWQSSHVEQDALMMAAESHFFAEDFYDAERLYSQLVKEYPRNPYLDQIDGRRFEIADYWLKTDAVAHKPFVVVNFTDERYPWNDLGGHGKRVLENLRMDNPTGNISDDATMRLGVTRLESGDYQGAADTFAELRMTYPDSEHQFNAQFLELQSLLASYRGPGYSSVPLTEAEKRVKQIARQFPDKAAEKQQDLNQAYAKIRYMLAERVWDTAEYRRKQGANDSARFYYQNLLAEYSDTPFGEQAQAQLDAIADLPGKPVQRLQFVRKMFGSIDQRPYERSSDQVNQSPPLE